MINSDKVAAWLRTAVPIGWGALVAFLLSRFPSLHELLVNPAVTMAVTGAVVVGWYSLWKWLEPRLPAWLTILVMGFDRPPVYFPGEIYDNGYRSGQDDMVYNPDQVPPFPGEITAARPVPPEVLEAFKRSWEKHQQAQPPRSIARPGESSGPHSLTDIMPAVQDETGDGEDPHRG